MAVMPSTPLDWARAACGTMMRRYAPEALPPVGHFHYHQGVFLSGMLKTWQLCGEDRYRAYAEAWVRSVFSADGGRILLYDHADLDDIQPGILLFPLLDAGGDAFFRTALDTAAAQIEDIPRCACGGLYHKVRLTGQMWLDGIYMAGPFMAEYGRRFGRPDFQALAVREIRLMRSHTRDAASGLWYHAWDETRSAKWADPETGLSPEFWGRSIGWVPVGILDVAAQLPPGAERGELNDIARDLLTHVCRFQSGDGRWYQVVNKPDVPGNWRENSCSCLFAAALARAVRAGLLGPEYAEKARRAFDGVTRSLGWQGEDVQIGQVCIGTGVGDYAHYCARPVSVNDLHGVGAFLLMCTELAQL